MNTANDGVATKVVEAQKEVDGFLKDEAARGADGVPVQKQRLNLKPAPAATEVLERFKEADKAIEAETSNFIRQKTVHNIAIDTMKNALVDQYAALERKRAGLQQQGSAILAGIRSTKADMDKISNALKALD